MFRKILCGTLAALALGTVPCAAIPKSEMSLGGVPIRARFRWKDVVRMYGEPTAQPNPFCMEYGKSVSIGFNEDSLVSVKVTENNGWNTPAGVHVGMTQEEVLNIYGYPDDSDTNGRKTLHVYVDDEKRNCALGIVYNENDTAITVAIQTSTMADWQGWYPGWKKQLLK